VKDSRIFGDRHLAFTLGHFLYGLISVSPNFVVTFISIWALKTLLYRNRQQLLRLNLEYWNTRLEQTLQDEMTRNNRHNR